ncbi:metallophosphoesterase 1-like [Centroberyx gerrardi]
MSRQSGGSLWIRFRRPESRPVRRLAVDQVPPAGVPSGPEARCGSGSAGRSPVRSGGSLWIRFRRPESSPLEADVATGGLRALVLSDPHILGNTGHWMDRLRREWQMGRSFQAAVFLLEPEVVFILGDLLDHGYHDNQQEWEEDISRFHQIFRCPNNTELIVVAGNHDVGYYYQLTSEKFQRFQSVFNHSALISRKGVNFVLVTSMALDGDCTVCSEQQAELYSISLLLNCSTQEVQNCQSGRTSKGGVANPPPSAVSWSCDLTASSGSGAESNFLPLITELAENERH